MDTVRSTKRIIPALVLVIALGTFLPGISVAGITSSDSADREQVSFYYDEHCEECINVMPYIDALSSAYPEIQISSYNICLNNPNNLQNNTLFNSFKNKTGIPQAKTPLVRLGSTVIEGEENISRDLQSVIQTKLGMDTGSPRVPVPVLTRITPVQIPDVPRVDLFYDGDCPTCTSTMHFVKNLAPAYPGIQFEYHDICGKIPEGKQNQDLYSAFLLKYGLSDSSAPTVFFGDTVLQGQAKITQDLEPVLKASGTQKAPLMYAPLGAITLIVVLSILRRRG